MAGGPWAIILCKFAEIEILSLAGNKGRVLVSSDWHYLGGAITGNPAVASRGPDRLDIFVRGLDRAVYHKWWNGLAWGPSETDWHMLGGRVTDTPTVVSWTTNRLDLFAQGANRGVWHKWWNGSELRLG